MDYNSILGVVLAGGQSKRFGQDKSQVQLGEKILIDYILLEILDQFNEILIIANNDIKFLNSKKITKIEDYKKDLGPLGGVLTALKWIKKNNKDYKWISTFPSDTPFFNKKCLQDFLNWKPGQVQDQPPDQRLTVYSLPLLPETVQVLTSVSIVVTDPEMISKSAMAAALITRMGKSASPVMQNSLSVSHLCDLTTRPSNT